MPRRGWSQRDPLTQQGYDFGQMRREAANGIGVRPAEDETPVFDRGRFAPVNPAIRAGLKINTSNQVAELPARYRTAADRREARRVVTARLLGDPKPGRAGRAPDCEESLRRERSDEAYRLLGKEPPANNYAELDLERVKSDLDRLAPRRWRPPFTAAAE